MKQKIMKQKTNNTVQVHSTPIISKKPQQSSIPSEYAMYRQIVKEIGLTSPVQQHLLRFNFKTKYNRYLEKINEQRSQEQLFISHQEGQFKKKQNKMKEVRENIKVRQERAQESRLKKMQERKEKTEADINKWEQIVSKNKKKEVIFFKESLKQAKKWNQKGVSPLKRKIQYLSQKKKKSQGYNQKVSQKSISLRTNSQKSLNKNEDERKFSKIRSQAQIRRQKKKKQQRRLQNYTLKKQYEQQQIERMLMMNIQKQKKISQARQHKKQIKEKIIKISVQKQKVLKEKFRQKAKKLSSLYELKNKELEKKLIQKRKETEEQVPRKRFITQPEEQNNTYLTQLNEDNTHKYNKIMYEKLRSISVILKKGVSIHH